ncbi:MAG: D-amino acid aminotransferase [Candidatus Latescibacterota bacterium]
MPEIAFLNGRFLPLEEAVVPIEDRGFQFGDGVYEVVATYGGRPYALEAHLQRLGRSLGELRLAFDLRAYGLEGIIAEGIARSGFAEALVYVQVTRGVAPRRHEFPAGEVSPTVVMTVKELHRPSAELHAHGVRVITHPDLRWKRCDIKSICLLPNVMAKQAAHADEAFEALLVDAEGRVTEGSSTSAFCVRDGVVCTAPSGPHILPSITRGVLLGLARELGIPVRESFCSLQQYLHADEVFLAGTSTEALGVVRIDDEVIGDGQPGPLTRRLRQAFLSTTG